MGRGPTLARQPPPYIRLARRGMRLGGAHLPGPDTPTPDPEGEATRAGLGVFPPVSFSCTEPWM